MELGAYTAIYRAHSAVPTAGQQDGGTVSSLLKAALEDKLAQAALLTGAKDNITPESFWGSNVEDISRAAGSRFLASPGLRKLTEAVRRGMARMIVVGRPCQVQALRKYQHQGFIGSANIISIGLFCMWSLSWSFKDYLQKTYPGINIQKITIPQHGVEVLTDSGRIELPTEKVKEFIRPGCKYCLEMTSELADISVGAFEAESGWNTVIVRSARGALLLQKAVDKGYLKLEDYPEKDLALLKRASFNKKARNLQLLKEAADKQGLKLFVDISQKEYQDILAGAEGMVKS
jgi:coenzyme F420-reducing hydrogenase beta subunit